jgi:hypothetical protein
MRPTQQLQLFQQPASKLAVFIYDLRCSENQTA